MPASSAGWLACDAVPQGRVDGRRVAARVDRDAAVRCSARPAAGQRPDRVARRRPELHGEAGVRRVLRRQLGDRRDGDGYPVAAGGQRGGCRPPRAACRRGRRVGPCPGGTDTSASSSGHDAAVGGVVGQLDRRGAVGAVGDPQPRAAALAPRSATGRSRSRDGSVAACSSETPSIPPMALRVSWTPSTATRPEATSTTAARSGCSGRYSLSTSSMRLARADADVAQPGRVVGTLGREEADRDGGARPVGVGDPQPRLAAAGRGQAGDGPAGGGGPGHAGPRRRARRAGPPRRRAATTRAVTAGPPDQRTSVAEVAPTLGRGPRRGAREQPRGGQRWPVAPSNC